MQCEINARANNSMDLRAGAATFLLRSFVTFGFRVAGSRASRHLNRSITRFGSREEPKLRELSARSLLFAQ